MVNYKIIIAMISLTIFSCSSSSKNNSNNQFQNTFNDGTILNRPLPDSRGIIAYENYQILVASGSETVEQISKRLNVDPERLASYNGVTLTYLPRIDEVLALPPGSISNSYNSNTNSSWNFENIKKSIENFQNANSNIGTPNNPIKHRVEPGDTAYSIARLYNVSVTSLAKWNGLDSDLNVIIGRELIIPVILNNKNNHKIPNDTNQIEKDTAENELKKDTYSSIQSSSNNNKNKNDENKSTSSIQKFIRPVNGEILRKYNPTSITNKNEGIDFAAIEGTPVKAAADGVVALISEPVGGLGKIILIKHKESVISIYGRVKEVKIAKGDRVVAGEVIGDVEKSNINDDKKQNYLHFELRKGTTSLDPEPLFK